jgi:hypothetical protein
MPGLFFTNAWMLAGLAALAVPVIIHLLLKRKKKRVRFSTVQFFIKQDEQAAQRRKIRNWLLLTLRLLICALLVLAFARPYLQDSGTAQGQQKRQTIILLDRSLSMQASPADSANWERAKETVRQVLADLRPDDRVAIVGCGFQAETLLEWAPPTAAAKLLDRLQPTSGAAPLKQGFAEVRKLFTFRDPKALTAVHLISDFQRSGCLDLASEPLPRDVEIKLAAIGDLITPNLAITDLQSTPDTAAGANVTVTSFSDDDTPELQLDINVDNKPVASHKFPLQAGGSTNLPLALPILQPGWHTIAAELRVQDALPADNARFQTVFVPEPSRVLVVENRPRERVFDRESFFVTTALNPGHGLTNEPQSRFALEIVSPDELAQRLASSKERRPCSLVVLPGLKEIPSALGNTLLTFLHAGGGLLVFLGDAVSANRYNAEFRSVLPGELGSLETAPPLDLESGWRIGRYDTNAALFAAFRAPATADLSLARFTRRFSLRPNAPDAVIAEFDDGSAFIVAGAVGQGHVVLINATADTAWHDWPKRKTFVPWLHETAIHLAGEPAERRFSSELNLTAAVETEIALGPGAANANCIVVSPAGQELRLTADEHGQLPPVTLDAPGVYSIQNVTGIELRKLALNVPAQESELAALTPAAVHQQIVRVQDARPATLVAGLLGSGSNQRELWRTLFAAVLVLLFAEMFLANRTLG